jgi:hypothetical protein
MDSMHISRASIFKRAAGIVTAPHGFRLGLQSYRQSRCNCHYRSYPGNDVSKSRHLKALLRLAMIWSALVEGMADR